jgi:hypothetical protein
MKQPISSVAAMMVLMMGLQATADTASVRKELTAQYTRMSDAFKRKDAAGVVATMAPNAQAKLPGGQVIKRSEMESSLKEQLANVRSVKAMTYKIDGLKLNRTTVIATVTGDSTVVVADNEGKLHELRQINTVRNTWTKIGKQWRIKLAEPVSIKAFLDGKPLQVGR